MVMVATPIAWGDGVDAMSRAALPGRLGIPSRRATTLVVPAGMIPRAVGVPTTPWAVWWTIPSPPIATTTSKPSAAAALDISFASIAEDGHIASASWFADNADITSRCAPPVNWEATGLAMTAMRATGVRGYRCTLPNRGGRHPDNR